MQRMDDLTLEMRVLSQLVLALWSQGRLVIAGEGCGSHNMETLWLSQDVEVKSLETKTSKI